MHAQLNRKNIRPIFVDCEAQKAGYALIALLDHEDKEIFYPPMLSKEVFWQAFCKDTPIEPCDIYLSMDL